MSRPPSRETENENMKPGAPPRPSTEPSGSKASSAKTRTDPGSGQTQRAAQPKNESAAEDRSPAAPIDSRVKPKA